MLNVDDNSWFSAGLHRGVAPRRPRAGTRRMVAGPAGRGSVDTGGMARDSGDGRDAAGHRGGGAVGRTHPDRARWSRGLRPSAAAPRAGAAGAGGADLAGAAGTRAPGHLRGRELGLRLVADAVLCRSVARPCRAAPARRGLGRDDRPGGRRTAGTRCIVQPSWPLVAARGGTAASHRRRRARDWPRHRRARTARGLGRSVVVEGCGRRQSRGRLADHYTWTRGRDGARRARAGAGGAAGGGSRKRAARAWHCRRLGGARGSGSPIDHHDDRRPRGCGGDDLEERPHRRAALAGDDSTRSRRDQPVPGHERGVCVEPNRTTPVDARDARGTHPRGRCAGPVALARPRVRAMSAAHVGVDRHLGGCHRRAVCRRVPRGDAQPRSARLRRFVAAAAAAAARVAGVCRVRIRQPDLRPRLGE